MNQGKLEVVKQEMARVNVDVLGIIKLKWTGMGEFNLDDHYIYYCGQESLRRKATTNLDSVLKSRDIILPTKDCMVKAMVFPVVMYRPHSVRSLHHDPPFLGCPMGMA